MNKVKFPKKSIRTPQDLKELEVEINTVLDKNEAAIRQYISRYIYTSSISVETNRQLDEIELLNRACKVLISKCNKLEKLIISNLEKEESEDVLTKGLLKIQNENATLGNLIAYYLQEQKNIEYSGYNIPFLYLNEILVRYRTDGKDIKDLIKKTFNDIRNIFKQINEDIEKL